MTDRVLLIHGIWNAKAWLSPLASRLRGAGFTPEVFGYSSVLGGPDVAVPALIARLRDAGPVTLLGHSLGGLIALEALRQPLAAPLVSVADVSCGITVRLLEMTR